MAKALVGFALFSGLFAIVAGCGGSAISEGGSAHAGAAGSGSGGAPSFAGSSAAGAGSVAGAPAIAGAPGVGCMAPLVQGECDAYQPSFWHNPKSGLCEPFIYGGCGGNANRYPSREACLSACPGGGSNWGACQLDSDCTLSGTACCDACDPVEDQDLLALNSSHVAEQILARPCAGTGVCAPCRPVSELMQTRKYFRPVCVAHQCSVLDVRQSEYTECTDGAGCVIRNGVGCCPECDDSGYVAVSSNANFCANAPQSCGKCVSFDPPPGLVATCRGGRCSFDDTLR